MPAPLRWLLRRSALSPLSWAVDRRLGPVHAATAPPWSEASSSRWSLWPSSAGAAAFALGLLALMLSYGGWTKLEESRDGIRTRSYFGVYTVTTRREPAVAPAHPRHHPPRSPELDSGRRDRADLLLRPPLGRRPRASRSLPIFHGPNAAVGVVGLGTGTLSCYAEPGQDWRFFEIDPAMVRIASEPGHLHLPLAAAPRRRRWCSATPG